MSVLIILKNAAPKMFVNDHSSAFLRSTQNRSGDVMTILRWAFPTLTAEELTERNV